ncbi:MAG: phage head closure protein [Hyphomicrobiaceae bacterium]
MSAPDIASLRHRLSIEKPVRDDQPGGGSAAITWQTIATVWARVDAQSGREIAATDTVAARLNVDITIRHRDDVDATMRLVDGKRIYEILAVRDFDGKRHWLSCQCEVRGP